MDINKPVLHILWLDDRRNPELYFKKKDDKGEGTLHDTFMFYNQLREKYDLDFTWVKTYKEFTNWILSNGLPEFVSFDHDLSKTSAPTDPKGIDCARWLVNYCRKNGKNIPQNYVHSANPKWRGEIKNILKGLQENRMHMKIQITENDIRLAVAECIQKLLKEDVFANTKLQNNKKGTIGLTYAKNQSWNHGNFKSTDMLKTDKMDENNEDTYIVPLKGGIESYNITSINGTEVMHYFKRRFEKSSEKTTIKNNGVELELDMKNDEWDNFMNTFKQKIDRVVNYCAKKFKQEDKKFKIEAVSVYPVPSHSSFNLNVANGISQMNIINLPVRVISQDLLEKDLRNLERDEDFIAKNQDYYNGAMSNVEDEKLSKSVSTYLDNDINRLKAFSQAGSYINEMNDAEKKILIALNNYKTSLKKNSEGTGSIKTLNTIAKEYRRYYDAMMACTQKISYKNLLNNGEDSSFEFKTIATALKYTKGPSVEGRSGLLWGMIKNCKDIRGQKSPVTGKPYKQVEVNLWVPNKFQIKNLSNGERMGLKNYYNPNKDAQFVEEQLAKIKGTIFVIFDDNISGGATLSDICYQCKQLGIEYIVPITFGKMATKWQMNMIPLNRPINVNGEEGFNM